MKGMAGGGGGGGGGGEMQGCNCDVKRQNCKMGPSRLADTQQQPEVIISVIVSLCNCVKVSVHSCFQKQYMLCELEQRKYRWRSVKTKLLSFV